MARRRGGNRRQINGILVLDKPYGVSSNGALQAVKRLFNAQKAGHTGSLDPLATGVLPLCFGEATKFSQYLLDADKAYTTTIQLGVTTTTSDAEGEVVETCPVEAYTEARIEEVLEQFRGEVEQVPSMFSAIKIDGQPLYKLARKGIEVDRPSRLVQIRELRLLDRTEDQLTLAIRCTKGTYVRTLAEDIGKVLGCGAHVIALRRTGSGPYSLDHAITMAELEELYADNGFVALDELLRPAASAVDHWPKVELTDLSASYIKQGQPVQVAKAPTNGWVRIFSTSCESEESNFLGIGEIMEDGRIAPRRLVAS